ncbi:uncharacterized protein CheA7a [Diabrotica undecimpunctata]|uniref:uncharacterized protein CheA7a n=1 Tax=Diabrotica undecimpunctata TaxID=50387 RepID=UPI003B635FBB
MIPVIRYFLVVCVATICDAVNVKINDILQCDNEERPIMFGMKIKNDGDKQFVEDGFMDTKVDFNDDLMNTVTIFSFDENEWKYVFSKNDDVCSMVENFMGEFAKEMEKSAGMKSSCPYPKGRYQIKNHLIDFSTFKYKEFPPGKVKIRSEFFPKSDEKKLIGCYEVVFTLTE